jgi:hypothetical protein
MRPFDQAHPAVQLMLVDRSTPVASRTQPRAVPTRRQRRRALLIALSPAR